ncbi:MAG: hypothetical protein OEU36_21540, partial [Gammaproteobacteria bacterium]|nr:hypothetical protein [Gammaproteobacteria bacterium]
HVSIGNRSCITLIRYIRVSIGNRSCITLIRYIRVSIPALLYLLRTPQGGTEVLAVVHGSEVLKHCHAREACPRENGDGYPRNPKH